MKRALLLLLAFLLTGPARAGEISYLGWGHMAHNDRIGDGEDRWQSGGAQFSWMFGPEGLAGLPAAPGELFELRLRGQVITPDHYGAPDGWDRPAAGISTITLHSHFAPGGFEASAGLGLAMTGPQTGLLRFQRFLHALSPASEPVMAASVRAGQIGNGLYPVAEGEAARRLRLSENLTLRPFIEGQAGPESFLRAGFDLYLGNGFDSSILVREGTTGFAYRTLDPASEPGLTLTFGADAARVFSSAYLPAADGYSLTSLRTRLRGGVLVQGQHFSLFQGVAWLGPEFSAQPAGQATGVLELRLNF